MPQFEILYAGCGNVDLHFILGRFSPIRKTNFARMSAVYDVTQSGYCDPLIFNLLFSFFFDDPQTTVQYFSCLACVK
jgi:hypothetical protein